MSSPAAVAGDRISAIRTTHQMPNPSSGAPQPSPPLPFSAPLTQGLAPTVLIGGKPAATAGSIGTNTPPHAGLHPTADPYFAPAAQRGSVTAGAALVLIENRPAARSGTACTVCFGLPGTLTGTAATVLIGG